MWGCGGRLVTAIHEEAHSTLWDQRVERPCAGENMGYPWN